MPVFRLPVHLESNSWSGAPGVNVWHIRTAGSPSLDLPTWATQFGGALDAIQTFYESTSTLWRAGLKARFGLDALDVDEQTTPLETEQREVTIGFGEPAPTPLALCVSWRTALRARRGFGRTFVGPLYAGVRDPGSGAPTAASLLTLRNAAAALVADSAAGNGWAIGVYGLEKPAKQSVLNPDGSFPHVFRDFVSSNVNAKYAVMRSRRD